MNGSDAEQLVRRLIEGVPGVLGGAKQELETHFRAVLQSGLQHLDLTTRSDFDVQARLLERARARVEQLESRLADLEKRLDALEQETTAPG
ncbi:MAG: accessory factor UbiK family protein [Steroidobacteraceae bacterium]